MRRKYDEFENQETDCRPVDCHIRRFVHRRLRYRSVREESSPENRGRYMDRVTGRKESGYESNSTAEKSCFHVLCHDRNDAYARIAGSDGRHRF